MSRGSGVRSATIGASALAVRCACALLLAAACAPDPGVAEPAESAPEDPEAVAPAGDQGPWPLDAVVTIIPQVQVHCDACHGAGMPPAWALRGDDIERIELERRAGYAYGSPGATLVTRLRASGEAERLVTTSGELPPAGIGSFGARRASSERGVLDAVVFGVLARELAATGLFRFDGEAATAWATHQELAVVRVARRGRPEAWVVSMDVLDDARVHPTFARVLAAIDAVAADIAWSAAPR